MASWRASSEGWASLSLSLGVRARARVDNTDVLLVGLVEEVRGLIDKVSQHVVEVRKIHSRILSAPNSDDSKCVRMCVLCCARYSVKTN